MPEHIEDPMGVLKGDYGEKRQRELRGAFLKERIIPVVGEITAEQANNVVAGLLYLDREDKQLSISLYVMSSGGDFLAALAIYDTMTLIAAPVSTVCMGMVEGVATLLLIAGAQGKRLALPSAHLKLELPEFPSDQAERSQRGFIGIVAMYSGHPIETIESYLNSGPLYFDAHQAITFGLIDEILVGSASPVAPTPKTVTATPLIGGNPSSNRQLLGRSLENGDQIGISDLDRQLGTYIIGVSGMGKSTLLLNMILQDINAGHGLCVLDPHGDLIRDVLARSEIAPERLVLLDPADWNHPFGLNLYECDNPRDPTVRSRTVDYVMGIFEKLWGDNGLHPSWGPQLEDLLRHITQTFVQAQDYTLADVPAFLEKPAFREKVLASVREDLREYWEINYAPHQDQLSFRTSTLNKIRRFTDHEILRYILGQSKSTLNIRRIMDEGKVLLVNLPEGRVGSEGVTLIGSLLTGQILQAMLTRVDQAAPLRRPFSLYCDEYYYFATADFPRFFNEGRKFGIKTVIAHQARYQLDPLSDHSSLAVQNRIVFKIAAGDAQKLRPYFSYVPPAPAVPLSKQPLRVLLSKGHANPTIQRLVEFLQSLVGRQEEFEKYQRSIPISHSHLPNVASLQNFMMTENPGYLRRVNLYERGKAVLARIEEYLYETMRGELLHQSYRQHTLLHSIALDIAPWVRVEEPKLTVVPVVASEHEALTKYREGLADVLNNCVLAAVGIGSEGEWLDLVDFQQLHGVSDQIQGLPSFLADLVATGRLLVTNPIRDTGVLGIEAVPAAQADIVSFLSNLDKYRARVKLQQGDNSLETTIETLPPPSASSDQVVADRMRRILAFAHRNYTRERESVEQEIRSRQMAGGTGNASSPRPSGGPPKRLV